MEVELEKDRDLVRKALDIGVARITGKLDETGLRDLDAPSTRVVSPSQQTKTPEKR